MKKTLVSVAVALALVVGTSVVPANTNLGLLSPDVVSAASEAAPATTPTTTTKTTTTKTSTTKTSTTKTSTSTSKSSILRYGSKGTTVKTLQTSLNKNGAKLKVDGFFGAKTLTAVKSYQKKNGLRVDGLVGPKTIAKFAVTSPNTTTPVVTTPVVTTPVVTTPVVTTPVDAVTTASIVNKNDTFKTAISPSGTWIIATLNDLTFTEELVLDGTFKNGKKNADGSDQIQRKIALYAQDDAHNVTERYTLTAPKLTVKSPKARIQGGTFKGDVYVTAPDFQLVDATVKGNVYVSATGFSMSSYAKVEGNVYFVAPAVQGTFKDATSSVTGASEAAIVDSVTGASIVNNNAAFEKAISKNGEWIIATLNDLDFTANGTVTKNLILDGTYIKTGTPNTIQRKIGLYTQDANKNVTARFNLRATSLTVNSANASIQHGTFKGNLTVSALNFQLVDTKVDGNVTFTSQLAKDTFKMDAASSITGKQFVKTN